VDGDGYWGYTDDWCGIIAEIETERVSTRPI